MQNPRIISLIASATEIVCAIGMRDFLIGRSHECDFPPSVHNLPVCTSPKFDVNGTSLEIDQRVKAVLQQGLEAYQALSVYSVNSELLENLQPTHLITQAQCEVCAVSLKDVERAVCEFTSSRPQIVSLEPNELADIWRDILRVADSLGIAERGNALCETLQGRMQEIARRASEITSRPRVALIEWIEPLMAAGNWMPELVEMTGGINLFGEAGKHSPWMTWEALVASDPDFIVVAPCGFDIARTLEDMPVLTAKQEWRDLRAVRNSRVFIADGNQYFNRPGPRVAESLEIFAEILHPQEFHFGHQGSGWIPFQL